MKLEEVALSKVVISENLRKPGWEKEVADLVKSIQSVGLKQPPLLMLTKEGKYLVVFGNRRVLACKEAGLQKISALVVSQTTEQTRIQDQLAENYGRKNLDCIEEAQIFKKLKDQNYTATELAKIIGLSESYISQRLQLLKLPPALQKALKDGKIEFAHARELLRIESPKQQEKLLQFALTHTPEQFKEKLEKQEKRQTKRGRPKKEKSETAKKTTRTRHEILAVEAKIDKLRVDAVESGNKLREEFFKGTLRALEWVLGNIENLV